MCFIARILSFIFITMLQKKPEICKETKQALRREDKEAKAKPKRKEKLNIFNALRATFQDFFWKTLNVKSLFVFSLKQYIEIVL